MAIRHFSLQFRLTLVVMGLFFAILAVAAVWIVADARRAVDNEVEASLEIATQLIDLLGSSRLTADPGPLAERVADLRSTRHLRIEVLDTEAVPPVRTEIPAERGLDVPHWFVQLVEPQVRTIAMPRVGAGPTMEQIMLTTDPEDEISESWREARRLILVMAVFSLGAGALVLLVIRWALRPLSELNDAVEQIERGDYSARVDVSSSPEVDGVIARFNRMAETLQATRARNEALAARSLQIQEDERRTLARELHDEMGQSISAIRAVAVAIAERETVAEEVRDRADAIADIASDVYASVRGMMHRLRPAVLDELGLVRALESMVDDWNSHHADAFCRFNAEPGLPPIPEHIAINFYRIVQEALTNVAKHACGQRDGTTVSVGLKTRGQRLELTIEDDGGGYRPEDHPAGLGLAGIRERAEAMGAAVTIDPGPGRGVRIELSAALH